MRQINNYKSNRMHRPRADAKRKLLFIIPRYLTGGDSNKNQIKNSSFLA